jgi:hypothetical protein
MTEQTPNLPAERKPQLHTGASVAALVPQTLDEAYRLADAMSRSGLTPNGIKTPEAVMVAIMAGAELGLPPFQACQSFAIVNGRPSLWGDSIPALLWANGFKIKEWLDGASDDFPDTMTARCKITRPDGEEIEGEFSVADAKKGGLWNKTGPWQTSPKRMLKMRARSFCARDGAADLLRGLFVAEEVQDFQPIPGEQQTGGTGMVDRLKARAQPADVDPAGFNVRTITEETAAAKPKRAKKADAPPAEAAQADPEPETIVDAEVEEIPPSDAAAAAAAIGDDDLPGDLSASTSEFLDPDTGISYPTMEARLAADKAKHADLSDEAKAGLAGGVVASGTSDNADDVQEGCAAPGDLYYHTDLPEIGGDGRRAAFKDGVFFSRISPRDDLLIYDQHAPLVSTLTEAEREAPVEEEITGDDIAALGGAIGEFWEKLQATTSWLQIKSLYGTLVKSDDFGELDEEEQDALRAKIWEIVMAVKKAHRDPVDQAQDVTAMLIWRCTQRGMEGADAIEGTFNILQGEPSWNRMKPEQQERAAAIINAQIKRERS